MKWIVNGAFKALSSEEMQALSNEDKFAYAQAKEENTQKNLNDLFAKYDEAKKSNENVADLVSKIKEAQEEANEAVKSLTRIVADVAKKGLPTNGEPLTFLDSVKKGLTDALPELVNAKKNRSLGFISIKAPAFMLESTNITGASASRLPQPEYVQGLKLIAEKNPFILQYLNTGSTSSAVITYTEEKNPEGDYAMTAEGALKPLLDFEIVPADSKAKKVAGVIKVSEEMLTDIDFMSAEINRKLRKKHDLKIEDNVINGDGTGENFSGLIDNAPAFSAGALALKVVTPNNSDVIRASINQIVVSSDSAYYPNVCFVNPSDLALMDLQKDSTGNYVLPPFETVNGRTISGVTVVGKTKISAGYFLIGDFNEAIFRNYVPFSIQVGWENDDFRKNLVTIIGESRNHFYIPSNSYSAFVYDQFSVAITALTKP